MTHEFGGDWPRDLAGRRVLVVNPLRAYWSMALCAEAALKAREEGALVNWFDAPLGLDVRASEGLQLNPQDRWRPWLYSDPLSRLRRVLLSAGIEPIPADRNALNEFDETFRDLDALRAWSYQGLPLGRAVHASLSGQTYRYFLDFGSPTGARRIKRQAASAVALAKSLLRLLSQSQIDLVITTNDRALPSGVALLAAHRQSVPNVVVYWGSSSDRLMAYSTSLHSPDDRSRHISEMWALAQDCPPAIAAAKLSLERQMRTEANIGSYDFRALMRPGRVPERKRPKRLTFFTGSPWEFSGFEESNDRRFGTQWEAASAIHSRLDPNEWEFVLRHHPPHPATGDHSEPDSWRELAQWPNVTEIQARDGIDSLELAQASDASAVFDSSIGITLVARRIPTLICGPASWSDPSWGNLAQGPDELARLDLDHIFRPDPEDLLPTLHYLLGSGERMRFTSGLGGNTRVNGHALYRSWLPTRIRSALSPLYVKWIERQRRGRSNP